MIYSLAITGPTASGKTKLSIELAKNIGAEIISCDSMQIYRGMDIGTAKADKDEREAVPHYMIDLISADENFSVEAYREGAKSSAAEIVGKGKIPMFVGGTGLYVSAVMRAAMPEVPKSSREYRDTVLESTKNGSDIEALWQRLNEIDPESAALIHKNNVRRVIRALEIYETTGKPKSFFDRESKRLAADFKVGMITLDFHNRENLYRRVDERVDLMIKAGLVDEVFKLYRSGALKRGTTAAQAIGYKEIISYLDGETSLREATELIKLSSRRYAKRQLTWFRHEPDAHRIYVDTEEGKMREFNDLLSEAECVSKKIIEDFGYEGRTT